MGAKLAENLMGGSQCYFKVDHKIVIFTVGSYLLYIVYVCVGLFFSLAACISLLLYSGLWHVSGIALCLLFSNKLAKITKSVHRPSRSYQ